MHRITLAIHLRALPILGMVTVIGCSGTATEPVAAGSGGTTNSSVASGGTATNTGGWLSQLGGSASTGTGGSSGRATGGTTANASGGNATGGVSVSTLGGQGGSSAGGRSTGGSAAGGSTVGGNSNGGASTGGKATGGSATGGTVGVGGSGQGGVATGGGSVGGAATGGSALGGAATGGKSVGGAATGGAATGGNAGNCRAAPTSYRNLFSELLSKSATDIDAKMNAAFQQLFHGGSNTVYFEVGTDQAYILDTGNNDVRSEGMSYGMMIAVQLNKQAEFNRLWQFAKQHMYHSSGARAGYFAWQVKSDGTIIDQNSAADGEEYFAAALIFANKRWGDGTGIFAYSTEAKALLDVMVHKGETSEAQAAGVTSMFDPIQKMVVFTPSGDAAKYTDPSYHLPAFYEVWSCFDSKNQAFWKSVATNSRSYFQKATHATTGLAPEYSGFDGTPSTQATKGDYRYDAWRVVTNVMMDHHFYNVDSWQTAYAARLGSFFTGQGSYGAEYTLSGTKLTAGPGRGQVGMNATLGFALPTADAKPYVQALWDLAIPTGQYRYYEGLLYMLGLLHASGNFRLWY